MKNFILQKLGMNYGGWVIPTNKITKNSICYCVGAGEDISFDVELVKRFDCSVFTFDPTPRAQAYFRGIQGIYTDKITYCPYGIWSKSEVKKFFIPHNPEYVSCSIVNLQKTDRYFEAECITISDAMKRFGHKRLSLLKLDIEGAEYEVIDSIIMDDIWIEILCVEFDELNTPLDQHFKKRIEGAIEKLSKAHFTLLFVDAANYTFINTNFVGNF